MAKIFTRGGAFISLRRKAHFNLLSAKRTGFLITSMLGASIGLSQEHGDTLSSPALLKKLSLEQLMNIEVTTVSSRPEKINEVASAIQVLSGNDIYRSTATRLPEALRLASNIQMTQTNSHDWAVTTRGFNGLPSAGGILANKLLVMIDGRSVYNPLFGGVYWDVQNVVLHDVDRIELVSGPGGTLWGVNAVNGVINVITKSARETQGVYASGTTGSLINDLATVRYGGRSKQDSNLYFRVYGQHMDQQGLNLTNGRERKDGWNSSQAGFRMDYYPSARDVFTLQGDAYSGESNKDSTAAMTATSGKNMLARFTRNYSDSSNLKVQAYYDQTWRAMPNAVNPFFYRLNTYDLDMQHRFPIARRHSFLYGGNLRLQHDQASSSFLPLSRDLLLLNILLQDEITLVPKTLKLTAGTKVTHNTYTGFEYQPCGRLAWTLDTSNTIWSSVSRAVRMPSRLDVDLIINPEHFKSESVIAYELGYRTKMRNRMLAAISTFFNDYYNVRSLDSISNPKPGIAFANSQRANSWGVELNFTWQVSNRWRLRGGYTYFDREIWRINGKALEASADLESLDPKHIVVLQSIATLGKNFSFDMAGRYVDQLPAGVIIKSVPGYFTFDARLAYNWRLFEFSVAGQNLAEKDHTEVGNTRIPRTIYARIKCLF